MDPSGGGCRDAVDRMRLLVAHPDLDDAGIVLDELAHSFPAETPHPREIAHAVVRLEGGGDARHEIKQGR